jgi:hypothetical protein
VVTKPAALRRVDLDSLTVSTLKSDFEGEVMGLAYNSASDVLYYTVSASNMISL